jgi:hypothetical protein
MAAIYDFSELFGRHQCANFVSLSPVDIRGECAILSHFYFLNAVEGGVGFRVIAWNVLPADERSGG